VSEPRENVVVSALLAEYRRIESRLDGATKRLDHAHKQVEIEGDMIKQSIADLLSLEDAITHAGGTVPAKPVLAEGEEPYTD
jgi:hypothetical protein